MGWHPRGDRRVRVMELLEDWHDLPAEQQPPWLDHAEVAKVRAFLAAQPPLVPVAAVRELSEHLARVASGEAFVFRRATAPSRSARRPSPEHGTRFASCGG